MKFISLITSILFTNINYSQVRTIDLVFSDSECGKYASAIADCIEHNEINSIYNTLSFDFDYDNIDFSKINSSITSFYRPNKHSSPGQIIANSLKGDTCYFERHYYKEVNQKIKWLAQIIITSTNSEFDNPILSIEYLDDKEFIERSKEIKTAFNGGWMKKDLNYPPPPLATRIIQKNNVKNTVNREINTTYINSEYNFGFEIDTSTWKNQGSDVRGTTQLFNGKFIEQLKNNTSTIDLSLADFKNPDLESDKEFEGTIRNQVDQININKMKFSDISYNREKRYLELSSISQQNNHKKIFGRHLFFTLNFEQSIYVKINSESLSIVEEVANKIRETIEIK